MLSDKSLSPYSKSFIRTIFERLLIWTNGCSICEISVRRSLIFYPSELISFYPSELIWKFPVYVSLLSLLKVQMPSYLVGFKVDQENLKILEKKGEVQNDRENLKSRGTSMKTPSSPCRKPRKIISM